MIEEPPVLTIAGRSSRNRPTQAQIEAFADMPTGFVTDAMDGMGALDPEVTRALFEGGMAAVSPNGVLGDPTGMNAELGRVLIEELAGAIVAELEGQGRQDPAPSPSR